jgi:tetratricopeptide (TPR) repeat protein
MFQSFNVPFASVRQALLVLAVLLVAGCGSPEDRAQSYYERGMKLLSQQDYVKASIEFKNALNLKKDLVDAWRGLAQIEERNQDPRPLAAILRNIVELDQKDVEARIRLARLLLRMNSLDEALRFVNAAAELDNRNAGVLGLKAGILFRLGNNTEATGEATAALEIDPANPEATVTLAAVRLARGDAEGALMVLEREPKAHMRDIGIQLFKIKVLEHMGDRERAELVFRNLFDLYPKDAGLRGVLVKYLIEHKRLDDAEKELRAWAAANPTDPESGLNLVRFLLTFKGPAAARQELVTRLDAGGEQTFRYQLALAEVNLADGKFADSVQLLERLATNATSRDNAVAAQTKLAEVYFSKNNFDAAQAVVSEILRKDDRNTNGLKLRAAIRMELGQLDAAIADARQALNDQPRSTQLSLLLATAYERSGSIELAEKQYADATKIASFDPAVGLYYVAFLRRRGDIARAEDILTEIAGRWPNNVPILAILADVRLERQNWFGAQEVADKIRRIDGDPRLADEILGVALSGRNKFDDSISILENTYAATSGAALPMVNLVNALVRAGKLDQAATFVQNVLQSSPDNARAYILLGSIQLAKNAPAEALKSLRTAIERQPKNTAGYEALANFHLREKNNAEALKVIRAGLEQQPESFALHLALAGVLVLQGDYEAAITEYEYLVKKDPGSLIAANNLASLLADYRADKASLERAYSLATILRKSPVPSFKDTLGWIYYQQGDYKNAIPLLEQAAAELPNRPLVRYHLGMSYIAIGELAKATEQLKKAHELALDNSALQTKIKAAQEKAAI